MTAVDVRCAACGESNGLGSRFCSNCGASLGEVAAPLAPERAATLATSPVVEEIRSA